MAKTIRKKRALLPISWDINYNGADYDYTYISDTILKYIVNRGYQVVTVWPSWYSQAQASTNLWTVVNYIADYGLEVHLMTENFVSSDDPNTGLPRFNIGMTNNQIAAVVIDSNTGYTYGQWMADVNSQTNVTGVEAEYNFDNVLIWQRSLLNANQTQTQWWDGGLVWFDPNNINDPGPLWYDAWGTTIQHWIGGWTNDTPDMYHNYTTPMPNIFTRLNVIDDVVYEVYWAGNYTQCIAAYTWFMANAPTIPLGLPVTSDVSINGYSRWWDNTTQYSANVQMSLAAQHAAAQHDLQAVVTATKNMDFYYACFESFTGGTPFCNLVDFTESLHLSG